jgi:nucleotide-binding universal stress UspA family protein
VEYKGIKHILYATNEESADDDALEVIQELNKEFKATIHFVHVRNKTNSRFAHIQSELVDELLEDEGPDFSFEIEEISGKSVTESLMQYCSDHPIDLMVVASKHRSFWEAFFHQSESKRLAKFTTRPLLIYHFD